MEVWTSFDPRLNLGLTKGVLVILAEKGISGALMPEWVMPRHSRYSRDPMKIKMMFLDFRGSSTQIKDRQNTISTPLLVLHVLFPKKVRRLFQLKI